MIVSRLNVAAAVILMLLAATSLGSFALAAESAPPASGRFGSPAPIAGATKSSGVALEFSAENLRDLYLASAAAQTELDEVKTLSQWLLGLATAVIAAVTLGGTAYIRREANKAATEARQKALEEIAIIQRRLERSRSDLDFALAQQRYSVANIWWRNGDFARAIASAPQALLSVNASIAPLEARPSPSANEKDTLAARQRYRCHINGDLAYYLTERYRGGHEAPDAERALQHIKRVVNEWAIFGSDPPLPLVDTYLFVLWSVGGQTTSKADRDRGKALLENYHGALRSFLRTEDQSLLGRFDEYCHFS